MAHITGGGLVGNLKRIIPHYYHFEIAITIKDEFRVNNNMILPLDKGGWLVVDRFTDAVTHGIVVEGVTFVQMEGNTPVKYFEIARATGLSKWQSYLTSIIEGATFNPKEEGCRKRQHYNYLNFYNCTNYKSYIFFII